MLLDSGTDVVILSLDDYLQMSANELIWEDDVFAIMPRMCEDISSTLQDGNNLYSKTGYDLCIDSSEASPAALAEVIFRSLL